ncbi:MAG: bis-aminopropyl spermidine synthase family protein [Candidatus Bathyarchaeota archaeon]|jgi:predicted methyltransferase
MGTPEEEREHSRSKILSEIASELRLKEGEEAVRRVLREIHRKGKVGTKDLARATRLPIPVAAAIRRELEKTGLVARKGGAVLTTGGEALAEALGMTGETGPARILSISEKHRPILERLRELSALRPVPRPQLDQAYATPETALRRALYMLENGSLAGRDVLFLGDDDLTSVAAGLLGVVGRRTVVDIDERLLGAIREVSEVEGLGIECVHHDLRGSLPEELVGCFDTFLTDPPYTLPGLRLFLSRGVQALRGRKVSRAYLAYPDKPPLEMLEAHAAIVGMGLYIDELIPRFNRYEGAEILANTTNLLRLTVTEKAQPAVVGVFRGELYTGELRPTVRTYGCRGCGREIEVGENLGYNTIEELKGEGCPGCGSKEGFRLSRKRAA